MASAIDATKPVFGNPTTQSVRDNFAAAKAEIEALQTTGGAGGDITSVVAGTGLAGGGTSGDVTLNLATPVSIANGGTNATTAAAALANLGGAPLASPVFSGTPSLPTGTTGVTQAAATNNTTLATTAYVQTQGYQTAANVAAGYLPLVGGTINGSPGSLVIGTPPGSSPSRGSLIANLSTTTTPPAPALPGNTGLQIVGVDGQPAALEFIAAAGIPQIIQRQSQGTIAAPSATQSTFTIGSYAVRGDGTSAWSLTTGALNFVATENWTNTNHGTNATIFTTPNGGGAIAANLVLDGSGNLTILGGTATKAGGGSWAAPSDPQLKTNARLISTGLSAIEQLRPIRYQYNGKGGTRDDGTVYVGLDARETAQVMPSLVGVMTYQPTVPSEDGEPVPAGAPETFLTVDPSELMFALINAVRELSARLAALEAGPVPTPPLGNSS